MQAYSDVTKLYRITSYVIWFINNIKNTLYNQNPVSGPLKLGEVKYAEIQWIKNAQRVFVGNNTKQLKATLGIYFDANLVLRCCGRLNKSMLLENAHNPILLAKDGHLMKLIIENAHRGIKDTLAEVRS